MVLGTLPTPTGFNIAKMEVERTTAFHTCRRKHFIYICSRNKNDSLPVRRSILLIVIAACVMHFSACNRKLNSVLVENPDGNVELVYAGKELPENLVKEIRFYPDGDTLSVTPMKKGAVDGQVSFYFPNNRLREVATFRSGKQDGPFKRYDKEGVVVFEGQLKNGTKDGVWITWYDEVQMEEQRSYLDDMPDGKWTYWYIDGNLKREEVYKLGKLIEGKDFN